MKGRPRPRRCTPRWSAGWWPRAISGRASSSWMDGRAAGSPSPESGSAAGRGAGSTPPRRPRRIRPGPVPMPSSSLAPRRERLAPRGRTTRGLGGLLGRMGRSAGRVGGRPARLGETLRRFGGTLRTLGRGSRRWGRSPPRSGRRCPWIGETLAGFGERLRSLGGSLSKSPGVPDSLTPRSRRDLSWAPGRKPEPRPGRPYLIRGSWKSHGSAMPSTQGIGLRPQLGLRSIGLLGRVFSAAVLFSGEFFPETLFFGFKHCLAASNIVPRPQTMYSRFFRVLQGLEHCFKPGKP